MHILGINVEQGRQTNLKWKNENSNENKSIKRKK